MKEVNIGFVGAGTQFLEDHGPAYKELEPSGVRLAAIADLNLALALARCDEFGIGAAYRSLKAMLDGEPDLHAIVIAVPNALHPPLATMALNAAKHVFVEKPMAIDFNSALQMAKTARAAERLLWVSQQYSRMWDVPAAISRARLGPLEEVHARWLRPDGIPDRLDFFTMRTAGGGVLMDLGPHLMSVILPALGMPAATRASARMSNTSGVGKHGERFEVEDRLWGFVDFGDGPRLDIDVAWDARTELVGVTFKGPNGSLEVPLLTGQPHTPGFVPRGAELVLRRPHEEPVTVSSNPRTVWECILTQTVDFVAAVRAHDAGRVAAPEYLGGERSLELGLLSTRVIDLLYRSARNGGRPALAGPTAR